MHKLYNCNCIWLNPLSLFFMLPYLFVVVEIERYNFENILLNYKWRVMSYLLTFLLIIHMAYVQSFIIFDIIPKSPKLDNFLIYFSIFYILIFLINNLIKSYFCN